MINEKTGLFESRKKFIRARRVNKYTETVIDKNGEEFIGVKGDWKIWDENGYVYFLNRYEFNKQYQPVNEKAFNIIIEETQQYTKDKKKIMSGFADTIKKDKVTKSTNK